MRPRKNESPEDFIARLDKSAPRLTRAQRARLAELLETEIGPPERGNGPPGTLGANKAIPAGRHTTKSPPSSKRKERP
jgi:hypothetical protein